MSEELDSEVSDREPHMGPLRAKSRVAKAVLSKKSIFWPKKAEKTEKIRLGPKKSQCSKGHKNCCLGQKMDAKAYLECT